MAAEDCNGFAWFQCTWNDIKDGWNTATGVVSGGWDVMTDAGGLLKMIIEFFKDPVGGSVEFFLYTTLRWIVEPSWDPDAPVAHTIRDSWMLPIVIVFLVCGILWQGFQMVISRRGEPLIRAVKAILVTAAAGGIAAVGTAALLNAGDNFSCWVLGEAMKNDGAPNPLISGGQCRHGEGGLATAITESTAVQKFSNVIGLAQLAFIGVTAVGGAIAGGGSGALGGALMGVLIVILLGLIMILAMLVQLFLLVVRGGSLIILVGVSQLAAAGKVTRATSGWLGRLIPWMLSLIFYKPAAALVYATALLFIGEGVDEDADHRIRNFIFGASMLLLATFAMPAMMKFFTWGFGALGQQGSLAGAAVGADNLGDDLIRIGQWRQGRAKEQADDIDKSLPKPGPNPDPAPNEGKKTPVPDGGSKTPAPGGGGTTTAAAAAGAAAAPASAGSSLIWAGTIIGGTAAVTQIGASLKKTVTNHMVQDD